MNEDLDNDFQKLYEKYKLARRKFCHDLEKLQRREENIRVIILLEMYLIVGETQ